MLIIHEWWVVTVNRRAVSKVILCRCNTVTLTGLMTHICTIITKLCCSGVLNLRDKQRGCYCSILDTPDQLFMWSSKFVNIFTAEKIFSNLHERGLRWKTCGSLPQCLSCQLWPQVVCAGVFGSRRDVNRVLGGCFLPNIYLCFFLFMQICFWASFVVASLCFMTLEFVSQLSTQLHNKHC